MNLALMVDSIPALLRGAIVTIELASVSLFLGALLGLGIAFMRLARQPALGMFARAYVAWFRGTPLLVQIFLIYYGLGQFEAVRQSIFWIAFKEPVVCAILALTLCSAAYASEIFRGGIQSVPNGQIEAAKAIGMSRLLRLRRIVFPLALRSALPAYGNEIMVMIKSTSLASTITVLEITGIARGLIAETFAPIEIFIVAGSIYLGINYGMSRLVQRLEHGLAPDRQSASRQTSPAVATH